jgi:Secretion system C-terminal sorting domain
MKKITLLFSIFMLSVSAFAQFPEGFEGATFPPAGWVSYRGTNSLGLLQDWKLTSAAATFATGLQAATVRYEAVTGITDPFEDWLVTPQVAITATNALLTFSDRQFYTTAYGTTYEVRVSTTSQTSHASFATVNSRTEAQLTTPAFTAQSINLSAYIGQSVYIAFVMIQNDGDNWYIDDVAFETPPTCAAPTAGSAVVTSPTSATLTLTSTVADLEVLIQPAGGTVPDPFAPDGTGVNVTGATYSTTTLTASTAYEFYVRSECTLGFDFSIWSGPYSFNTTVAPNCATLTTPIDLATDVVLGLNTAAALAWTAPASGDTPSGYNLYFGADPFALPLLNPTPFVGVAVNITGLNYNTTYYWQAVAVNAGGEAIGCSTFSFTTEASPGYCLGGGLWPTATYTPAICNGTSSNTVTTSGYAGEYSNVNVVAGTAYQFGSSVETDFITISADAGLTAAAFGANPLTWTAASSGTIRFYTHLTDQCGGDEVNRTRSVICGVVLASNTFETSSLKTYPNPIKEILNISYDKNISKIVVYNLLGQEVVVKYLNSTEAKIDLSNLTAGNYILKLTSENEVKTIKVVKE